MLAHGQFAHLHPISFAFANLLLCCFDIHPKIKVRFKVNPYFEDKSD
ncbi:hypothetical protein DLH88_07270 [Vibrio parahaemolyticus]|nr:hypothetical protein [Vibrio parahaemolyticus]EGR3151653.1 hypothetical protein [Vibrio parahaemolyticus]TNC03642.1 hypothetical protein FHG74_22535 [Vibrio diabolicus]